MKKFLSIMAFALMCITSASAAGHFTLFGVEIAGTHEQFKQKMLNVGGMRYDNNSYDIWVYMGPFEGISETEFYVCANSSTNQVYKISIYLPEQSSWNELKTRYMDYYDRFNNYSGLTMENHNTGFESPYREGHGDEMEAVGAGKCNYESSFYNGQVYISLKISQYKQIQITIYDLANSPTSFSGTGYYSTSASDASSVFGSTYSGASDSGQGSYSSGSTSSAQLTFMTLPVYGTAKEFADRLVAQRACRINSESDIHRIGLTGTFAGYNNCDIYVNEKPATGQIYQLRVFLPEQSSWSMLKQQYLTFKGYYDYKYTCTNSVATFTGSYREGDGNEMQAVQNESINFRSEYTASWGTITISITKWGVRAEYNLNSPAQSPASIDSTDQ